VHAAQTLAYALAAGMFAQALARHVRLPGIVLLLALGAGLGPDLLGLVDPGAFGEGLFVLVDFAVAVILFEGGLNLEWSRLRRLEAPIRGLLTIGSLTTWMGATAAAVWLLSWSWPLALLFGSLVVVTGPTVITPLARESRLKMRIRTVLEAEGVLIDPVGAFLAVLALQIALSPTTDTLGAGMLDIASRLGAGAAAGVTGGLALGLALRVRGLVPAGLENVFTLASVILLFELSNHLASHAGILAVPVAGMVVGNMRTHVDRDLREFKDQLTVMLVGMLFVLLAADVRLADVAALGRGGALVVATLVLVVRPVAVAASTWTSDMTRAERAYLAWIAPRGIVAAAIASLSSVALDQAGLAGGTEIRAMVFATIGATVVLAGLTAAPLARLLGLRMGSRTGVAIFGANGLGLALAAELREAGRAVVFLDNDPNACNRARAADFTVVFGDPLSERSLLRARIEEVSSVIALTPNDHLNTLFVAQACDLFQVPEAYVALGDTIGEDAPEHVRRFDGRALFEGPHDKARWDVRARAGDLEVVRLAWRAPEAPRNSDATSEPVTSDASAATAESAPAVVPRRATAQPQERYVLLAIHRGKLTHPYWRGLEPKKDDVATAAVYAPDRDDALAALAERGWHLLPTEDTSEQEEVVATAE
jgi:NhaP-type Na+/H+ or K+/H+ antiporter